MCDIKQIINELAKDLPIEAIQKTFKQDTKKGYDTTGYSYQYCVDRFNEICEDKWGFDWEIINQITGNYKSGQPFIEITIKISIWIFQKENIRTCVGGHIASNFTDALKGSITNGFKKTAAFWGVGASAFRGTIDDDFAFPDDEKNKTNTFFVKKERKLTKEEAEKTRAEFQQQEEAKTQKERLYLLFEEFKQAWNKIKDIAKDSEKNGYQIYLQMFEKNKLSEALLQNRIVKIKQDYNQFFDPPKPTELQQTVEGDIEPNLDFDGLQKEDELAKGIL